MSSLGKTPKRPGPELWRSLEALEAQRDPEAQAALKDALKNEFPAGAPIFDDPVSRRRFVQLMGASAGLAAAAGAAGCRRWEREEIVPFGKRPEGYVPGVPKHYASAAELGGVADGVVVTAYDGRPIKIEGNPSHPYTGPRTSALTQASVLNIYDPDRSNAVVRRWNGSRFTVPWSDFDTFAASLEPKTRLRVLSEASSSPTLRRVGRAAIRRFSTARWHEWEPLSRDNEREGLRQAYGSGLRALPLLDQAQTIVAIDSDILADHPGALKHARDFAKKRRPEAGPMSRVYSVESRYSHTGAVSDHRLPLRAELMLPFLMAVDARLSGGQAPKAEFLADAKVQKYLEALVEDLAADRSRAVVVVGSHLPPAVHAVAARINDKAAGQTVAYVQDPEPERPAHVESIRRLVADMEAGQVDALVIVGGNPAYDAPADLNFAGALAKVEHTIHLSHYEDETSELCTWHLPRAHFLETWGDARTWDGTLSVVQPIIEPLTGGRSPVQVMQALSGRKVTSGEDEVRTTLGKSDADWRKILHDGHVRGSQYPKVQPPLRSFSPPELTAGQKKGMQPENGALEVLFTRSSHTYDGRFANNAWLQETPDFHTKLTWDNAALIAPSTADKIGIKQGDLIEVTLGSRKVEIAAYVMPGQAPGSIALSLGHGRWRAGRVGGNSRNAYRWDGEEWVAGSSEDTPGFNVYPLRSSEAPFVAVGASIAPTGKKHWLVSTQDHWQLDTLGREEVEERIPMLIKNGTVADYNDPSFAEHMKPHGPPSESLWKSHPELGPETTGHRWGMATDLSTCIGCNACLVACQAENNVPVVGKREVARTREMHWIRLDRYFEGDPNDPKIIHQPVACQQCENAPCEEVCPVGATIHTDEGLNDMVYNRCVGTRYCANNCAYKVRRFNFLDWHARSEYQNPDSRKNKLRALLFNPEVSVRSRGVMEKCTFCVQRIEVAKIAANNDGKRPIRDGEVTAACAQACPTDAIVFGDLADPNSKVSKAHKQSRQYALLGELNTHPRNVYLARIWNPNPKLAPPAKSHGGHGGGSHSEHGSGDEH